MHEIAKTALTIAVSSAVLCWSGAALPAESEGTNPPEISLSRFRTGMTAAIPKLSKVLKNIECHATQEEYTELEEVISDQTRSTARFCFLGKSGLSVHRFQKRTLRGRPISANIYCSTSDYYFHLHQLTPNGTYLVREYGADQESIDRGEFAVGVFASFFVRAAFELRDLPIATLLEDPKCTLVMSSEPQRPDAVKVEFQFSDDEFWYDSGWFVVDPSLGWSVRKYEIRDREPGKTRIGIVRGNVECDLLPKSGIAFPKMVEIATTSEDGDSSGDVHVEIAHMNSIEQGKLTPEDFKLSAFGLPDVPPPSLDSPPSRRWIWLIAINLGLLVLIGGMWWKWPRTTV